MRQYRVTLKFSSADWIAVGPHRETVTASTAAAAALDVLARWSAVASELRQHTLVTVVVEEVSGRPQMVAARAASPRTRRRG